MDGFGGGALLPVPDSPSPVMQDPNHPYVPNYDDGRQPTQRIGDTGNPNLKPWAREAMEMDNREVLAGKTAYRQSASCKPAGVPGFMIIGGGSLYFVQGPEEVVMIFDSDAQVRRIRLNESHSADPKPSWYGESEGHYEGETLVLDTIGLNAKTFIDNYRTPHTEKLHVTERWTISEDGQTLEVLMTVDDPDTFYRPWKALRRFSRKTAALPEIIYAENNRNLFDYGIPVAGKADF